VVRFPHRPSAEWLVGGGELGDRIRSADWSATPLGIRSSWPESLRTVVNLMVASRVPMVLTWGRELVLLYNDAYREIAVGKHPGILGRPLREAWPEIWGVIEPIFAAVARGESVYQEDAPYVLERRGFREEAYFTVCYSPVRAEDGTVGGTLVTHQETTVVLAERAAARQALREQTALLRAISDASADVIFAKDREGRLRFANPATLALVGKPLEAVIGRTDAELLDDEQAARQVMENDRRVMETGIAQELEERVPLPDGAERIWSSRKMPFRDDTGAIVGLLGVSRDITERTRAEAALRESEEKFRAVLEKLEAALASMTDAVFIADADGRLVNMNEAFATFYRFGSKEECARTFGEYPDLFDVFLSDGTVAPVDQWAVPRALRGETVTNAEYGIRRKDTGEAWFGSYSFAPIRKDGRIVGAVVVSRDITETKRTEQALRETNQRLREADLRKDEFLSAASHELRTPLATLRIHADGLSRMLSGPRQDEARIRRKLDSMDVQLDRLQGLVHELLDITRISAGRLRLERQRCDLAQLAAEAVERFEDRAERAGVELALHSVAAPGIWDPLRIDQVLTNLLDNALKHAPGSRVEVGVTPIAGDAVLTVRDFGPGISPDSQARIFQQYERAAEARVFGGLGLGLWISRQIVEAHGGTISVESTPGAGSSFMVRLPRREDG
jgi:PAS domain S-box-containing protein